MAGKIYDYLVGDHQRLDNLLNRAASADGIEAGAYHQFRAGLLKHIAVEEKILLPAAQRLQGGEPLAVAAKLRLDHGALVALLVPTPTPRVIAALRAILRRHNATEEGTGGVYEACEKLAGAEADEILRRLQEAPDVKVLPHVDSPFVMDAARRALARAGYDLEV